MHSTPMHSHAAAAGACAFQRSRQDTEFGCPTKAALARVWYRSMTGGIAGYGRLGSEGN